MGNRFWKFAKSMNDDINALTNVVGEWTTIQPEYKVENWDSVSALNKIEIASIVASHGFEFDRDD